MGNELQSIMSIITMAKVLDTMIKSKVNHELKLDVEGLEHQVWKRIV